MSGHYRILSLGKDFVSPATETMKRILLVPWKRGKGPAWRVRGLTADVRPIHRPYGRFPFPFRKGHKKQTLEFTGFPAQIIQHEVDHLAGILI